MKLVVTIQGTELREKDESNRTAFIMYQLSVESSGKGDHADDEANNWTIFRRYSQFHELMTVLAKNYPTKKHPVLHHINKRFPPKQATGNLADAFVEKRKGALQLWTNKLFQIPEMLEANEVLGFFEARKGLVQLGSVSPPLRLTDVHGRVVDSTTLNDKTIVVYSAASRYNFSKLTQWLEPCIQALMQKYPCLKVHWVSLADLRGMPEKYVPYVRPGLLSVDKRNRNKQLKYFAANKSALNKYSRSEPYFIADFTGETLSSLGFDDANWTFRVSIVMDGIVQGTVQSSTKNIADVFTKSMERCIEQCPSMAAEDVEAKLAEAEGECKTKEKSVDVKAGKVFKEILTTSEKDTHLTWKFAATDGSVNFGVSYIPEDSDKEQTIMPFLPVTAKPDKPLLGCWDVTGAPGKYIVQFGNKGNTFFKMKLAYQVAMV